MLLKNVEKKEDNTVVFQVEAEKEEFEKAVQSAYLKNRGQIYIPGFRKGKAPRAVIEGMYGHEVFYQDALDIIAPDAFEFGMKEADLKLVGSPSIVDFNVTDDRTAVFSFSCGLYPEVTLGQYKGLEAVRSELPVTDEDVQSELDSVRRRNARKVSVEREAQIGDTANIDYEGLLDDVPFDGGTDKGHDLELGSNSFVPGFEEQIVGMKIGEEKEIDITFPEDYVEDLAGKAVVFKVKLNSLTVNELPEADDEFAKDVSEFDTLEEYKADLRKTIEQRRKDQADGAFRTEIISKAVDNMSVAIPEVMIRAKEEEMLRNYAANFGMADRDMSFEDLCKMMGLDEAALNVSVRPGAEFQVKSDLLLEAVIKAEDIQVSEEDRKEYVERISSNMGVKPEQLVQYFGDEFIDNELRKEKATNILVDSAVVKEAEAEEAKEEPAAEAKEEPAE
ncbi:MAG: trigger factor [Oscillospiraceae bacterium]|nr:trigger factor [Oscillospiraceae bacterium]